jgi:anti-sigma regulatory factor (Ser/Thr protein kinase)
LLPDSIVIPVTQLPHSRPPGASRDAQSSPREGETLVNRTHAAAGFHAVADPAAAVTATLPGGPFEAGAVFLHRDVFLLPAHRASVAAARNRVGERLRQWGLAEPIYDDVTLVVSELFTNALVHTESSEISCRLQTTTHTVYLAITDQGVGPTGPQVREPDAESGRGLLLVDALAELWGVSTEQGRGRTVWAILPAYAPDEH